MADEGEQVGRQTNISTPARATGLKDNLSLVITVFSGSFSRPEFRGGAPRPHPTEPRREDLRQDAQRERAQGQTKCTAFFLSIVRLVFPKLCHILLGLRSALEHDSRRRGGDGDDGGD